MEGGNTFFFDDFFPLFVAVLTVKIETFVQYALNIYVFYIFAILSV